LAYDIRFRGGVTGTNRPAHIKIFRCGVSVAARDFDGDGRDEILTGAATGVPHVKGFRGLVRLEAFSLFPGDPQSRAGVNVG